MGFRFPISSARVRGVHGIVGFCPIKDPGFDIDGLPNPFTVYFPVLVHNGHTAVIYVGALLVSPPAGWTDSEQQLGSVAVGANLYTEKNNATRATPGAGTNETLTLRLNYYSDAGYSVLIGYDTWTFVVYWESVSAGTVDDVDDFEVDLEGWTRVNEVGTTTIARTSLYSYSGIYSMYHGSLDDLDVGYLTKTLMMGAGSRAYIFGYLRGSYSAPPLIGPAVQIITPVETVFLPVASPNRWSRFGARLNPGASNEVRLRARGRHASYPNMFYDLIRWVRY